MLCRYGWFAAINGIERRWWMTPKEASDLIGVPTAALRKFASQGVISYIQGEPRAHRRYLLPELEEIVLQLGYRPTLSQVSEYISAWMAGDETESGH